MSAASSLRKSFFESIAGALPVDRLFDGVTDIVFFVKDMQCRYMAVNDTLAARCGLTDKKQAIGRTAEQLFPSPLGAAFAKQDREILSGGHGIRDRLELHLYPGGGSGWCLTYKEPIHGKNGGVAGICGISRDLHAPAGADGDYAAMSSAIAHIHDHFEEPLRLPALSGSTEPIAQVALACGYSDQSAFSRQFKQAVGISPLAYRNKEKGFETPFFH
jgi:hypothetical protein